jgi:hypothetical protein
MLPAAAEWVDRVDDSWDGLAIFGRILNDLDLTVDDHQHGLHSLARSDHSSICPRFALGMSSSWFLLGGIEHRVFLDASVTHPSGAPSTNRLECVQSPEGNLPKDNVFAADLAATLAALVLVIDVGGANKARRSSTARTVGGGDKRTKLFKLRVREVRNRHFVLL